MNISKRQRESRKRYRNNKWDRRKVWPLTQWTKKSMHPFQHEGKISNIEVVEEIKYLGVIVQAKRNVLKGQKNEMMRKSKDWAWWQTLSSKKVAIE